MVDYLVQLTFNDKEINFLRNTMPYASEEFFDYLRSISFRDFTLRAPLEGSLIFAGEPILIIEGPLGAC